MSKKNLVFATNNAHKIAEVAGLVGSHFHIIALKDIKCLEELPETQTTLEGNALQKARYVRQHYGYDCFSEDTGLEVEILGGAPGVYTARYAGEARDPDANMDLLLKELEGKNNRKARFRTIFALILGGKEFLFEGIANGHIHDEKRGTHGFGYDPVFIPDGYDQTFAEIDYAEKNRISHRAKAFAALTRFLNTEK